MSDVPLIADHDLQSLLSAARAEGHGIDLERAEVRSGWENVVLNTADGWILRFPRTEEIPFDRELALLDRLHDHLPVPIPRIVWTGRQTRMAAYRRIDGAWLDLPAFAAADPLTRDRVAAGLSRFLAAMHAAVELPQITALEVPRFGADGLFVLDREQLPRSLWPRYDRIRTDVVERLARRTHPAVLLHNDFHAGNLVLDSPLGRLAGVWDFSCVQVGDPSLDFRYLVENAELGARVASAYAARTGREIDLGLALAALRLEQVSDALTEGRDPTPYL